MQQRKPNNSGCYWHQSLNTYLLRIGCPLLTKLVAYRRSNKVIYCCHILAISTVWRTSEPDQKLAAQSPPLLQAGTGASFLYLSTPPPPLPPFSLIATHPLNRSSKHKSITTISATSTVQSLDHQLRDERHQRNPRDRMVCEKHLARECSSAISVSYPCTKRCSPSRRSI